MNRKRNKLMKLPPVQFAVDMLDVYFFKRVGRAAAELAYFLILTFFPIIICVSIFVERLHLNPSTLLTELTRILPRWSHRHLSGLSALCGHQPILRHAHWRHLYGSAVCLPLRSGP